MTQSKPTTAPAANSAFPDTGEFSDGHRDSTLRHDGAVEQSYQQGALLLASFAAMVAAVGCGDTIIIDTSGTGGSNETSASSTSNTKNTGGDTGSGGTLTTSSTIGGTGGTGGGTFEWNCNYSESNGAQWKTCAEGTSPECDIYNPAYHYTEGQFCPEGSLFICDDQLNVTVTTCPNGCSQGAINSDDVCKK